MKRSKYIIFSKILILWIVLLLQGCSGRFLEDPLDPRLPIYTEKGNNVAGALLNEKIWTSRVEYNILSYKPNPGEPSIVSYSASDSLVIIFRGELETTEVLIEFHLSGESISSYTEILNLQNRKILLDGQEKTALIRYEKSGEHIYKNGDGQIFLRNIRFPEGDTTKNGVISGTFGFTAQSDSGEVMNAFYGRFDYRISRSMLKIKN